MSAINLAPGETGIARIVASIRQLIEGRSNATGSCTLAAGVTTTTVQAPNCATGSAVFLFPQTANAAAEVGNGTIYVKPADVLNKSFTITHANSAQIDRKYFYAALG